MNTAVWTYLAYLTISVALTIWVARELVDIHGHVRLAECLEDLGHISACRGAA